MKKVLKTFLILFIASRHLQAQEINYLHQIPAGNEAKVFAKGIVSTDEYEHSSPAFSTDGKKVLWTRLNSDYSAYLLEMNFSNGQWSSPARPSFSSSGADDLYPVFSTDGHTLYFGSRRNFSNETARNEKLRLWKVTRKGNDWDSPVPMDTALLVFEESFGHSVSRKGNFYFSFPEKGGKFYNIAFAQKKGNGFAKPQILGNGISTEYYEDGPFIAPDESYLIFESDRPVGMEGSLDLYISFKNKNGEWSKPINMGTEVNSKFAERFAKVSPDGKYLFFGSTRGGGLFDIYWMSADIISKLRKEYFLSVKEKE